MNDRLRSLQMVEEEARTCKACSLCEERRQVVFGDGPVDARVMLVGEAPGKNEDEEGKPFVGESGSHLISILKRAGRRREDFWITNVVKCRPPGNRDPLASETKACVGFLNKEIRVIQPDLIIALGGAAGNALVKGKGVSVKKMREDDSLCWQDGIQTIPVAVTYHPAFALRRINEDDDKGPIRTINQDIRDALMKVYGKISTPESRKPQRKRKRSLKRKRTKGPDVKATFTTPAASYAIVYCLTCKDTWHEAIDLKTGGEIQCDVCGLSITLDGTE